MNHFEQFAGMMDRYLTDRGYKIEIKTDLCTASYSTESKRSLCGSRLTVVDMDRFAKKGYRKIILPDSASEDDSVNTADAFLINGENKWYFVEFKDAKLSNSKASVLKKAYSNVYAVLDVLYAMDRNGEGYQDFDYADPVQFIRNHVSYVLVFCACKNPRDMIQMKNHRQKGEKYLPEFMKRLQGYIYKEAYAVTETVFEYEFVRHFRY